MKPRTPLALMGSWLALALTPIGSPAATATGTLTGDVSSAATGNLPVGAQVEAPALGRRVFTDPAGRFVLQPALLPHPAASAEQNRHELWYRQPADAWVEAMPLGNGRLGTMVQGAVDEERLIINENTLW